VYSFDGDTNRPLPRDESAEEFRGGPTVESQIKMELMQKWRTGEAQMRGNPVIRNWWTSFQCWRWHKRLFYRTNVPPTHRDGAAPLLSTARWTETARQILRKVLPSLAKLWFFKLITTKSNLKQFMTSF